VGSCEDSGVGSGVGSLVGRMLGLLVGTWLGLSLGAWLGLTLDGIMLGLSMGLLVLGWMEGAMLKPSLGLLPVGLILGAGLILGLRLAWSWKKAPAIAGEGQTAQYGPSRTDLGSFSVAQAVSLKALSKSALVGNLVRISPIPQSQRSWLNEDAPKNINLKSVTLATCHPPRLELNCEADANIAKARSREETCKQIKRGVVKGTLLWQRYAKHVWPQSMMRTSHSTCHLPRHLERSELKLDAKWNMYSAFVTDQTPHCDKSWLKAPASSNI
jgi:hypothetical protein